MFTDKATGKAMNGISMSVGWYNASMKCRTSLCFQEDCIHKKNENNRSKLYRTNRMNLRAVVDFNRKMTKLFKQSEGGIDNTCVIK